MRIPYPLLTFLVGCVVRKLEPAPFVPTNAAPPVRPKSASEVAVVSTAPGRPFIEVGFIEGRPTTDWDDPAAVLANMRSAAGQHGCDALLITGVNNFAPHSHDSSSMATGYHGACLIFVESIMPQPSPASVAPAGHAL